MALLGFAGSAGAFVKAPRGDVALRRVLVKMLPKVEGTGRLASNGRGSPEQVQAQYDAARDFEEALLAVGPVSRGCASLLASAQRFARAEITQAEGVDRPSPALLAAGVRLAASAERELRRLPYGCSGGRVVTQTPILPELLEPRSNETFTGHASALAPVGTTKVDVVLGGSIVGQATLKGRKASVDLTGRYRRRDLEFRFRDGKEVLGVAKSRSTWLLPQTSERHLRVRKSDRTLTAKLALLASGFRGQAGIWIHNLSTGATASWNEDARFPAASIVKLGVLAAALKRFGPRPERSRVAYDLQALTAWSSNLAANRLVRILGGGSVAAGSRIAQAMLRRLGASSSTYTGEYVIGTVLVPIGGRSPANAPAALTRSIDSHGSVSRHTGAPDPPPLVSQRVTTARDLGRIFYLLHAAAMNDRSAVKTTGLTLHEARLGIALLLASEPKGDNLGLFRPSVGPTAPMAQKNGWLNDARHTAAILYTEQGPIIVVLLTYRPGITRGEAAALGSKVLRLVVPLDAFGA